MNSAITIQLTSEEKYALEKNIRGRKTAVRLAERSKIILLSAEGLSNI